MKFKGSFMLGFLTSVVLGFLTSCTYSINLVHTEGQADDVLKEEQGATATVTPNINIP